MHYIRLTVLCSCAIIRTVEKGCFYRRLPHAIEGMVFNMAVSEAHKKASAKWDAANMATLGVKLKKDVADQFRAYCTVKGVTVNTELRDYVQSCVAGKPVEAGADASILTPAALCAAQTGAKLAGEELHTFVERAVKNESKRDEMQRKLLGK